MNTRLMMILVLGLSMNACSNWPRWHPEPPVAAQPTPPKPTPTPTKKAPKKPTTVGEAPRPTPSAEKKRTTEQRTEARRTAQPTPPPRTETPREEQTISPTPTPAPESRKGAEYPYASPVPGKPGFVTSPYAPYAGQVDVQGFAPGSEARDPYTGKIFRVP